MNYVAVLRITRFLMADIVGYTWHLGYTATALSIFVYLILDGIDDIRQAIREKR